MVGVIVAGPGFVAVGHDHADAAVWTSPDGTAWSRVPHNESVFGGEDAEWMASVTAGGPGLVAVGSAESGGEDGPCIDTAGENGDAAVWLWNE